MKAIQQLYVAAAKVKPFDAARLHEKLEFFVMSTASDPARGLLELRSEFWSFVEMSAQTSG